VATLKEALEVGFVCHDLRKVDTIPPPALRNPLAHALSPSHSAHPGSTINGAHVDAPHRDEAHAHVYNARAHVPNASHASPDAGSKRASKVQAVSTLAPFVDAPMTYLDAPMTYAVDVDTAYVDAYVDAADAYVDAPQVGTAHVHVKAAGMVDSEACRARRVGTEASRARRVGSEASRAPHCEASSGIVDSVPCTSEVKHASPDAHAATNVHAPPVDTAHVHVHVDTGPGVGRRHHSDVVGDGPTMLHHDGPSMLHDAQDVFLGHGEQETADFGGEGGRRDDKGDVRKDGNGGTTEGERQRDIARERARERKAIFGPFPEMFLCRVSLRDEGTT